MFTGNENEFVTFGKRTLLNGVPFIFYFTRLPHECKMINSIADVIVYVRDL